MDRYTNVTAINRLERYWESINNIRKIFMDIFTARDSL